MDATADAPGRPPPTSLPRGLRARGPGPDDPRGARLHRREAPATRSLSPTTWPRGAGWPCAPGCSSASAAATPASSCWASGAPHPVRDRPDGLPAPGPPRRRVATARAAAATGTVMCLSTLATPAPPALADAAPEAARWFQLYVLTDRGVSRELVADAARRGYEALVVTVDLPCLGIRERELRVRVARPASPTSPRRRPGTDARSDPRRRAMGTHRPGPELVRHRALRRRERAAGAGQGNPHRRGRRACVEHGAAGRDRLKPRRTPARHRAVGRRRAARDRRRGGRPHRRARRWRHPPRHRHRQGAGAGSPSGPRRPSGACGLAVAGADGVRHVLEILLAEFDNALALVGCPRAGRPGRELRHPGAVGPR